VAGLLDEPIDWRRVGDGQGLTVGALQLTPFAVPHDAAEPLQLVLSDGARRLGVVTDIGRPTAAVAAALSGVHALLLECNHDRELLWGGAYPPFLKARIGGDLGHLSNAQSAQLLAMLDRRCLGQVVAGHLSRQNNRPELACAALAPVLGCAPADVRVAGQGQGCDWVVV
jgi:phosphoribosyl 1,2-cyclic phosphodiesterase